MRQVSLFALVASSLSLAGCAGGGGAGVLGSAYDLAEELPICGLPCDGSSGGGSTGGGGTTTPPAPDTDGDGTPDDEDTDGDTGSGAGGNPTNLTPVTGARTIALEEGTLVVPSNGRTSLSTLSMTNTLTTATNTAAVASILGTKPTQLKIGIDTEGTGNSQWPVPILMDEYVAIDDTTGLRIPYGDPSLTPADYFGSNQVDAFNGIGPDMNIGSGADYREYRAVSDDRNEVMQVWSWDDSYALQYRNASGGGEAKQQAWSFGGNATTNMPAGGTGTYAGRFAATATTSNFMQVTGTDVDPNALWQLQGATNLTANFATDTISGTLSPATWTSYQSGLDGYYTWDTATNIGTVGGVAVALGADFNYTDIYGTNIKINGTFDPVTGTAAQNSFTGTAKLTGAYVSGDNPMYGGFFGAGAHEVAGVFNVEGILPDPTGGDDAINDDRAAYLSISGAFHGTCQAGPDCTP